MKTIWKKFSEGRPPLDRQIYVRTLASEPILAFIPASKPTHYQVVGTSDQKPISPTYQWCPVDALHEIEVQCGISLDDLYYAIQMDDNIALFVNHELADGKRFFEVLRAWMEGNKGYDHYQLGVAYGSELLNELLEEKGEDVTAEEVEELQSYAFRQLTRFVSALQDHRFPPTTGTPDEPENLDFFADWDGPEYPDGFDEEGFPGGTARMDPERHCEPYKTEVTTSAISDNPKDVIGSKKLPLSTVPWAVVAEMAAGMGEGAIKYGKHNYEVVGIRNSIYFDACLRHLIKWFLGQDIDPDSGIHHVTKALTSLAVLRDAMIYDNVTDDRPPPAPPEIVEQIEAFFKKLVADVPDCGKHYDRASMKRRGEL